LPFCFLFFVSPFLESPFLFLGCKKKKKKKKPNLNVKNIFAGSCNLMLIVCYLCNYLRANIDNLLDDEIL